MIGCICKKDDIFSQDFLHVLLLVHAVGVLSPHDTLPVLVRHNDDGDVYMSGVRSPHHVAREEGRTLGKVVQLGCAKIRYSPTFSNCKLGWLAEDEIEK